LNCTNGAIHELARLHHQLVNGSHPASWNTDGLSAVAAPGPSPRVVQR
jgi:hypothetical protein